MKRTSWGDEEFIVAVKSSISIAETLRKLGLVPVGGNYRTAHKRVKELGLDTSHWLGRRHLLGKSRKEVGQKSLADVLLENSEYSRGSIKRRLLLEGILKNECAICRQGPVWNTKPLVLILDHINGIGTDNRLENLRIVCHNCDSQLETFCGKKNKGRSHKKEGICISCGRRIGVFAKHCPECYHKSTRRVERPHIDVLTSEVNELGYEAVGRKYEVSGRSIKKWINYSRGRGAATNAADF